MKIVPIRPPGLALPPREIQISANFLAAVGREESTDSFVRTWVQELSHVRHPIPDDYWLELENYTGYEEGLAEGVARLLVIQDAGMHPRLRAYSHYAYAYRYLAEALHVDPTALFRELWKAPMGRVREWLPEAVDGILHQNGVSRPSSKKPQALRRAADELFFRGKSFLAVDETALRTAWQEALS